MMVEIDISVEDNQAMGISLRPAHLSTSRTVQQFKLATTKIYWRSLWYFAKMATIYQTRLFPLQFKKSQQPLKATMLWFFIFQFYLS